MEHKHQQQKVHVKDYSSAKAAPPDLLRVTANANTLTSEIGWLRNILETRLREIEHPGSGCVSFIEMSPPPLPEESSTYSDLVKEYKLSAIDRLLFITSLTQHFSPEVFGSLLIDKDNIIYPKHQELGGYVDKACGVFMPTLKTVLYLLAGSDESNTNYYHLYLWECGTLLKEQIISLRSVSVIEDDTNLRNHLVTVAPEYVHYLLSGQAPRPDYGRAFPATLVTTEMEWEDLVVPHETFLGLQEVLQWVSKGEELLSYSSKINPSYPCLFFGPPGTGKSLAAKLIGKTCNKNVFRIDLSMIVSKYIGETEKNLAYLFDRAANKDWILFFDEADALFGKRTNITDSKDKWANLEMSYLLQRMEEHRGLTILATNNKGNLDHALTRRFQQMVYFPCPGKEERQLLWEKATPPQFRYEESINLEKVAKYEFTGAQIANIIKRSCLTALAAGDKVITAEALMRAMVKEMDKENRTL